MATDHPIMTTAAKLLTAAVLLLVFLTTAQAEMVRVTVSLINVRAEPGSSYKIITSLKKGELLPVIDSVKGWWKVKTRDGLEGWVYKKAVHLEKEDYRIKIEVMSSEILGDYLKWALLNEVYLEEYRTARLDIMVTPEWRRLDPSLRKSMMLHVAQEFTSLCEEDNLLKTQNTATPYVAFFDRFNTLIGKANRSDAVFAE